MSNYKTESIFPSSNSTIDSGLSKREYFAAHAPEMPDWYRSSKVHCVLPEEKMALMVSWRWDYADAMLSGRGE